MKTVVLAAILVALSVSVCCAVETQVNAVISWDGALKGNLVHRDIRFAGITEDEIMLGKQVSPRINLFGTYTQDSKDNHRLGAMINYHSKIDDWSLDANLFAWQGLDEAQNRTKLAVYCTRPVAKKVSLGLYYLHNKAGNNPEYAEYGPIVNLKSGRVSSSLYLMNKNSGKTGLQFDLSLSF